jgi:MscS family membrane protein
MKKSDTITQFFMHHTVIVEFAAIVLVAAIVSVFLARLASFFRPRLAKTAHVWDDSFIESIYMPVMLYIWLNVAVLFIQVIVAQFVELKAFGHYFSTIKVLLILVAFFWFLFRYASKVEEKLLLKQELNRRFLKDKTNIHAVALVVRILLGVFLVLTVFESLGGKITSFLALGGFGTLAISFAAKDSIANLFGGIMIYWDRPFSVGDWIRSPDRDIEGTVEQIGWRLTRIRTFDKRPLYVPNGVFSIISVENAQKMWNRRIKSTIGLRYCDADKIKAILKDIETMLRSHEEIDPNQMLMVNFFEFGASSLNFFIYVFTKTTEWMKFEAIRQDVFLKTIAIIAQHGAECAFPTTTISLPDELKVRQFKEV